MFYGCSSLKKIGLSTFKTNNALYMNGLFCDCSAITYINLSKFRTKNVTKFY